MTYNYNINGHAAVALKYLQIKSVTNTTNLLLKPACAVP